jgi:Fungal protein kinase
MLPIAPALRSFQNQVISPHLKTLVITNTSNSSKSVEESKFPFELKPDCSVYASGQNKNHFDPFCVDFVVEFKKKWKDPFVDIPSDGGSFGPFLSSEGQTHEVLGQLTAYATAILSAQYRTHTFMVFIFKAHARLIRWDRTGALVTKAIPFNEESYLFDFFIRYDIADNEARGRDSTVSLPAEGEINCAKTIVPEFSDITSFLAITTQDQDTYTSSRFIIPRPGLRPDIPVGRWTRSSLACDIKRKRRVYLKDSWRVLLKDIEPEGEIYRRLHEKKVPNISSCLWAGDVGIDTYHRSQTDKLVNKYFSLQSYWRLTPHRHYRIVLGVVGRKLEKFNRTWESVNAMYAALKGKITIFLAINLPNLTRYSPQRRIQRRYSSPRHQRLEYIDRRLRRIASLCR